MTRVTRRELLGTNARLKGALGTILDCEDEKCFLCGRCLAAAQETGQPTPTPPCPPQIPADDPVRVYRGEGG